MKENLERVKSFDVMLKNASKIMSSDKQSPFKLNIPPYQPKI